MKGRTVLLIDSDLQSNLTTSLGYSPYDLTQTLADVMNKYKDSKEEELTPDYGILYCEEQVDLMPASIRLGGLIMGAALKLDYKSLIISNSSIFPDNWTEKTLMEEHESIPFNPDIATAFYRAGYIESWGRGIKKICDACEKIGGEKPEYIIRGSDVMVIFKPVSIAKNPKRQNANEVGVLDGVLENKIKNALIENSNITQKELSSELNIPYRTLQRVMKSMDQNGIIQRTGGKRYGRWIVNK